MEIRTLKSFLMLGKELHFAKAAEKLFITQPALTKQIKQLEHDLDVRLFDRNKRKVSLTKAGNYLMEEAEFIINHLDNVVDATRRKAKGEDGELRIGFVGSAMQNIIPILLKRMKELHPTIYASLDELNNKAQLDGIANESLDLGFVRLESVHKGLRSQTVYEDSFSLVVAKDHPSAKNFKSLKAFADEPFILFSNDYSQEYYDNVMSIFKDHGFEPIVSYRSVQANSIFRLVEQHLGVAIVPSALSDGVDLEVEFISLAHLPQRTRLLAVWSEQNRNDALNKFIEIMSIDQLPLSS